ncbi:MAG: hypothetical protein F6K39_09565 [Okeania sp. SIO3B3]|nr:hypothetical protein [Okeania sp. SIO3B3]
MPHNLEQSQQQIQEIPVTPTPNVQPANSNTLLQTYDHIINDEPGEQSTQQHPIVYETSNQSPIAPPTTSISNTEKRENGRLSKDRKLKRIEFFILIGVLGVVVITVLSWFLVRKNRKTNETESQNKIVDKSNSKFSNTSQNAQIKNNAKLAENITDNSSNLDSNKITQVEFKTPIYSPNSPNSKVIGFLYGKQDDQPKYELDLWVLIPKNYLSDSGKYINIPTDVILPLFQENGQSYFLGYLLTGRYEFFKPRKTPNPFKDSRWVKVKVKLRN